MSEAVIAILFYVLTMVYVREPLTYPYRRFHIGISILLGTVWAILAWRRF